MQLETRPCSSVRGGCCSLLAVHHICTIWCTCPCQDTCNWIFLSVRHCFVQFQWQDSSCQLPVTNCRKYSDNWSCGRRLIWHDTARHKKLQDGNMMTWLLQVFLAVTNSQSLDSTNSSGKLANQQYIEQWQLKMKPKVLTKTSESSGMWRHVES
jgi:hypothetical protein